jgi:hypothetical protein
MPSPLWCWKQQHDCARTRRRAHGGRPKKRAAKRRAVQAPKIVSSLVRAAALPVMFFRAALDAMREKDMARFLIYLFCQRFSAVLFQRRLK